MLTYEFKNCNINDETKTIFINVSQFEYITMKNNNTLYIKMASGEEFNIKYNDNIELLDNYDKLTHFIYHNH